MRIFYKIVVICIVALVIGFIVNQINPQGIHWRLLFSGVQNDRVEELLISMDDAFLEFIGEEALFIDIRPTDEFSIDHIPNSVSLPWQILIRNPDMIKVYHPDEIYILYDFKQSGRTLGIAASIFERRGFKNIKILSEGFAEWLVMEYPVALGEDT